MRVSCAVGVGILAIAGVFGSGCTRSEENPPVAKASPVVTKAAAPAVLSGRRRGG